MNRRRNFALPVFELRPRVYAVTVRGMLCRALTYPHVYRVAWLPTGIL